MGDYMIYMILTAVMSGIGMLVSARLKSKFNHYSQIPLSNGMTGGDVAKAMLRPVSYTHLTLPTSDLV